MSSLTPPLTTHTHNYTPPTKLLPQAIDLDVTLGEFIIITPPRETRTPGPLRPYAVILRVMADDGPPTTRGTIRIPHGIFKAMPDVIAVQAFASKLEYLLPDGSRQWLMHGVPASESTQHVPELLKWYN